MLCMFIPFQIQNSTIRTWGHMIATRPAFLPLALREESQATHSRTYAPSFRTSATSMPRISPLDPSASSWLHSALQLLPPLLPPLASPCHCHIFFFPFETLVLNHLALLPSRSLPWDREVVCSDEGGLANCGGWGSRLRSTSDNDGPWRDGWRLSVGGWGALRSHSVPQLSGEQLESTFPHHGSRLLHDPCTPMEAWTFLSPIKV